MCIRDRQEFELKVEKVSEKLREKIASLTTRIDTVQRFQPSTLPRAVQIILDAQIPGVYGTIRSLCQYPAEYEVALSAGIGAMWNYIVVENAEVAVACIRHLKKTKGGTCSFIPLDQITPRVVKDGRLTRWPGVIAHALDIIQIAPQYMRAAEFVFGRLLIVETIEDAKELFKERRLPLTLVSLEGDHLLASGLMKGGAQQRLQGQFSIK